MRHAKRISPYLANAKQISIGFTLHLKDSQLFLPRNCHVPCRLSPKPLHSCPLPPHSLPWTPPVKPNQLPTWFSHQSANRNYDLCKKIEEKRSAHRTFAVFLHGFCFPLKGLPLLRSEEPNRTRFYSVVSESCCGLLAFVCAWNCTYNYTIFPLSILRYTQGPWVKANVWVLALCSFIILLPSWRPLMAPDHHRLWHISFI